MIQHLWQICQKRVPEEYMALPCAHAWRCPVLYLALPCAPHLAPEADSAAPSPPEAASAAPVRMGPERHNKEIFNYCN